MKMTPDFYKEAVIEQMYVYFTPEGIDVLERIPLKDLKLPELRAKRLKAAEFIVDQQIE